MNEREQIEKFLAEGCSAREIARRLNRSPSTISRELKNAGRENYPPDVAHFVAKTFESMSRNGKSKILMNPQIRKYVCQKLEEGRSPYYISKAIKDDLGLSLSEGSIRRFLAQEPKRQEMMRLFRRLEIRRTNKRKEDKKERT